MVYFRTHYHRCDDCDGIFECQCEAPASVTNFICEECQGEENP